MQQEDFIKRQIDQLGRVLGKILADLIGLKSGGQVSAGIEAADQALKTGLGLDIGDLISVSSKKIIKTLQEDKKLSNDGFEKLADIFYLLGEGLEGRSADNENMKKLYERSLTIYEFLDKTSSTYSFDRHAKIEKIKNVLKDF